jgi:uncharacterized membrane protein YdfJ with MMPL/SSD domain
MFEEPARAIARNTIVISLGFTPLLFAPLIPYQTVGIFLASIMLYSGLATLWVLPALLTLLQKPLFGSLGSIPAAEDENGDSQSANPDNNQEQDNKENTTS